MNINLNYEGFEENLVSGPTKMWDGVQYLFRFDNGYGASVIKSGGSYGGLADLWELAVTRYPADADDPTRFELAYDTVITDDVIGWSTDEDIRKLLGRIKELPNHYKT